jgi:hypothetical protein
MEERACCTAGNGKGKPEDERYRIFAADFRGGVKGYELKRPIRASAVPLF